MNNPKAKSLKREIFEALTTRDALIDYAVGVGIVVFAYFFGLAVGFK